MKKCLVMIVVLLAVNFSYASDVRISAKSYSPIAEAPASTSLWGSFVTWMAGII